MDSKVVYRHRRLDTFEIFYIGIGNLKRPYDKIGRTKHWKSIVNKVGYQVEILATNLDVEDACELEILLIEQYGRLDLNTGLLINLTDGGEGVIGISENTRLKMREAKLGLAPWNKGIPTNIEPWNKGTIGLIKPNSGNFLKDGIPWNKDGIGLQKGEDIGTSKLTEKEVIEIINSFIPYKITRKILAEKYNVSEHTIKDIITGKSWKHLKSERRSIKL